MLASLRAPLSLILGFYVASSNAAEGDHDLEANLVATERVNLEGELVDAEDQHRNLWNEPLIIPIEKPDLCETGPLKGYHCHHIPPPASYELWFCPKRMGPHYSIEYALDLLRSEGYSFKLIPGGKEATRCTCGSLIVTPPPQNPREMPNPQGQFIGIPIPSFAFLFEDECNAMCAREEDDPCSLCTDTQVHYGGGQREIFSKCVHRSEVPYVGDAKLFANKFCKQNWPVASFMDDGEDRDICDIGYKTLGPPQSRPNPAADRDVFVDEVCFR